MRPDGRRSTALRAALATLMLVHVACSSRKQKRQLFREHVLPYFGGKIPDSAFRADRLALNMMNKEGISMPDGILFDARPKESYHQSPRVDPEISDSIIKMVHTPDGRFVPSEGQGHHEADNEVETTYKILFPANVQRYQLPRFRPVLDSLQLPIRPLFENGLSANPVRGQLGVPFYPTLHQTWNSRDTHRPYVLDQFNHNANKIVNFQQNFNTIHLTASFPCDKSGKMYPDPETQCQVFHLCHYNGLKETFVCPQGMRFDPTAHECRIWYMTPCLNMRRPFRVRPDT